MSETTWLNDSTAVEIDSDGVTVNQRTLDEGTQSIDLDWDEFHEFQEWLGFVSMDEHRRVRNQRDRLARAVGADLTMESMDPAEISEQFMRLVRDGGEGAVIEVVAEDEIAFVGVVRSTSTGHSGSARASRVSHTVTVVPVAGASTDADVVQLRCEELHEPQTRDYPGYHGIEELGLEIPAGDDETDWHMVERLSIVHEDTDE